MVRNPGKQRQPIIENGYYQFMEIPSSDTSSFEIEAFLRHILQGEGTFHILFLHENVVGVLYDTYYWIRFRNNPFPIATNPSGQLKVAKKDLLSSITLFDGNTTGYIYSKEKTKDVLTFCDSLSIQYHSSKKQ